LQQNAGTANEFERDPIWPMLMNRWLLA